MVRQSAQNFYIKGSKLNFNGYGIWAKLMEISSTMYDVKLVDISGTKRGNIFMVQLKDLKKKQQNQTCIRTYI